MSRIAGIVIDLFHTLVDPRDFKPPEFWRAREVARRLELDEEAFVARWGSLEEARNRGHAPPNVDVFADAARATGHDPGDELLRELDALYGQYQDQSLLEPHPDAMDTLTRLGDMGLGICLLSNAEPRDIRCWPDSPLADAFDATVFSCHIGAVKPERDAYEAALAHLDVPPEQAVFAGDGGSGELRGARDAGFGLVVAVRSYVPANGLRDEQEQARYETAADAVAARLADLPAMVKACEQQVSAGLHDPGSNAPPR